MSEVDDLPYLPRSMQGWRQLVNSVALLVLALALVGKGMIVLAWKRPSAAVYILTSIKK